MRGALRAQVAGAEGAAALKFLRAAGYPDAERRAADWVRSGLRVVGDQQRDGA